MGYGRWGGPDTGGGRLNTQKRAERGNIGRKERGDGQDVTEGARSSDESQRGEKGRYQNHPGREYIES